MNIGIDLDGVVADFDESFINTVIRVTGKDLFPARPFDIPTWDYPQHYGYTDAEVDQVWARIGKDRLFWRCLFNYPDAKVLFDAVGRWVENGHSVYFITNRAGVEVKRQTEEWLDYRLPHGVTPTVIISAHKGLCAQALGLDVYIDDKYENCLDTRAANVVTIMRDQPWNRGLHMQDVQRVTNLKDFVKIVDEMGAKHVA